VPSDGPPRLVRRFGAEAGALAQLIAADPELAQPVAEGLPVLAAEFAWGVLAEGALTVDDLLERRTRLSLVPPDADAARGCAEAVLARYRSDTGAATAALVADR
jgi:glycerol-3-phosphate dehydrogenase